jgi:HK97 family phage prohead protease
VSQAEGGFFGITEKMLTDALARRPACDLAELRAAGRLVSRHGPDGNPREQVEWAGLVKGYDAETGTVTVIASDDTADRYADMIVADGWRLDNYARNNVVLIDHSYRVASIVGAARAWVEKSQLLARISIDSDPLNVNAQMVARLLKAGLLHAVSVGFLPLRWQRIIDDKDQWTGGYRYLEQDLLEISWIPVPANPNALVIDQVSAAADVTEADLRAVSLLLAAALPRM